MRTDGTASTISQLRSDKPAFRDRVVHAHGNAVARCPGTRSRLGRQRSLVLRCISLSRRPAEVSKQHSSLIKTAPPLSNPARTSFRDARSARDHQQRSEATRSSSVQDPHGRDPPEHSPRRPTPTGPCKHVSIDGVVEHLIPITPGAPSTFAVSLMNSWQSLRSS